MAQLIVRKVASEIVKALKLRAARHGRSAEAEHREILGRALRPQSLDKPFKELLLAMPRVGRDRDFERDSDGGRPVRL